MAILCEVKNINISIRFVSTNPLLGFHPRLLIFSY